VEDSTTEYKRYWEKLEKDKETREKERQDWLKEKEDLNY